MSYRDDTAALMARVAALEQRAARVEQLERRVQELELENRRLREAAPVELELENRRLREAAAAGMKLPSRRLREAAPGSADAQDAPPSEVYIDEKLQQYVADLLAATRAPADHTGLAELAPYVLSGARDDDYAVVVAAARARADDEGRPYVVPLDIRHVVPGVLRERVILSAGALEQGVTVDGLLERILDVVDVP